MNKKILIIDGISGVPMGLEIDEAFHNLNIPSHYVAAVNLNHRSFYKPLSAINKAIHKHIYNETYYRYPKLTDDSLVKLIKETKPDIVFVIGFLYRFFDLNQVQKIKKEFGFELYLYDTDSCNLFTNKRELVYFFNNELPIYDHIFSFSKTTTQFINKLNQLDASHLPFGAKSIPLHTPDKVNDILFVGSADMRRVYLLEQLTQFKLKVYGSKWQRNHSVISPELNTAISPESIWGEPLHQQLFKSKIILNITRSTFFGVETGINLRIFETLAAQSFLLTDHTPELADLFKIGEEIESYSSSEELVDKVSYYLKNEDKRNKIAIKGYESFLKKHSWNKCMEKFLVQIK